MRESLMFRPRNTHAGSHMRVFPRRHSKMHVEKCNAITQGGRAAHLRRTINHCDWIIRQEYRVPFVNCVISQLLIVQVRMSWFTRLGSVLTLCTPILFRLTSGNSNHFWRVTRVYNGISVSKDTFCFLLIEWEIFIVTKLNIRNVKELWIKKKKNYIQGINSSSSCVFSVLRFYHTQCND